MTVLKSEQVRLKVSVRSRNTASLSTWISFYQNACREPYAFGGVVGASGGRPVRGRAAGGEELFHEARRNPEQDPEASEILCQFWLLMRIVTKTRLFLVNFMAFMMPKEGSPHHPASAAPIEEFVSVLAALVYGKVPWQSMA